MTITELARNSGVGVETVRYYQRLGLLAVPPLRDQVRRRYGLDALAELRFVRRCKALGFTLKQIAVLVQLRRTRRGSCNKLHERLEELTVELEVKRRELEIQQSAVQALRDACSGGKAIGECAAFARLEREALQ